MPPQYEPLPLRDRAGSPFVVVVNRERNSFEEWLVEERPSFGIAHLIQLILKGAGTLIDVGAHIGTVSIPVAKAGSRVLAIEMHPENCLKLFLGRAVNALPNLHVVQAAVTSRERLLYYVSNGPWAAIGGDDASGAVAGYSLDRLLEMHESTSRSRFRGEIVLKIDVEGHDHEALLGAERLIERRHPIILFESMLGSSAKASRAAADFLRARQYELFAVHDTVVAPEPICGVQETFLTDYLAIPSRRIGPMLSRIRKGMEVRPLSPGERLAKVRDAAVSRETLEHPLHAIDVIAHWKAEDPSMAKAASQLVADLRHHPEETVRRLAKARLN